ncbi:hypothetical protein C8R44DRAFT_763915 [Mycena epipterygia]|nr:hypothetical protein C8R44DRAFT_763915 [Mycena epipterygia]
MSPTLFAARPFLPSESLPSLRRSSPSPRPTVFRSYAVARTPSFPAFPLASALGHHGLDSDPTVFVLSIYTHPIYHLYQHQHPCRHPGPTSLYITCIISPSISAAKPNSFHYPSLCFCFLAVVLLFCSSSFLSCFLRVVSALMFPLPPLQLLDSLLLPSGRSFFDCPSSIQFFKWSTSIMKHRPAMPQSEYRQQSLVTLLFPPTPSFSSSVLGESDITSLVNGFLPR